MQSLNLVQMVEQILKENEFRILELQKDQLYAGLSSDGKNLRLSILDDPYFKTRKQAQAYSDKKDTQHARDEGSIFKKRDKGIPNLIVTGSLVYDRIFVKTESGRLIIDVNTPILSDLKQKYGEFLGLSPQACSYVTETIIYPQLKVMVYEHLKG